MVEYAKQGQEVTTGLDIVCPKCFRPLEGYRIARQWTDRYDRQLRHYFGWCTNCNLGSEVIQFLAGEGTAIPRPVSPRWCIHKHRYFAYIGNQSRASNEWQVWDLLPEAAVVVTGPGGDYDRPYDPQIYGLLKQLHSAVHAADKLLKDSAKAIVHILKTLGAKS